MKKNIFSLIFISMLANFSFAQKLHYKNISLPENVEIINDIWLEENNTCWVATNAGVFKISDYKITETINDTNNIDLFKINAIFEDSDKNIWLGNYKGQIIKYKNNKYEVFKICDKNGEFDQLIMSINQYDNNLYITTSEGCLIKFDKKNSNTKKIQTPCNSTIFDYYYDKEKQTQWLSCSDGLFLRRRNKKWKQKKEFSVVYGIFKSKNQYWAVGRNAQNKASLMLLFQDNFVFKIKLKDWMEFDLSTLKNPYMKFNETAIDQNGNVWVATEEGILIYNPYTAETQIINQNNSNMAFSYTSHIKANSNTIVAASDKNQIVYITFK